jgi:hypothetical protein
MNAEEAAQAAQKIKAKVVIPMHYTKDIAGSKEDAEKLKQLLPDKVIIPQEALPSLLNLSINSLFFFDSIPCLTISSLIPIKSISTPKGHFNLQALQSVQT